MREIHIADSRHRNSRVNLLSRKRLDRHAYVDSKGKPVSGVRLVKGTLSLDQEVENADAQELAEAMVAGDPEVDLELFGKRVHETARIYLTDEQKPALGVSVLECVHGVDGKLKEERPLQTRENNINSKIPLSWGRLLPKKQCYNKFVFARAYQLTHGDGLTYDFLYQMASQLQEAKSMMLLGAGEKGNQPLVTNRNGTPYRGFLEGRIDGDRYLLVLHLTHLELKPLPETGE